MSPAAVGRLRGGETVRAAARFVVAGGFNTLVTGAALSLLAAFIDPSLAYTLVFAAGIALSTVLAGRFVYRARMTARRVVAYVAVYLAVYVVGLVAVRVATGAGLPGVYTGLVVFVTAPLSFLGGLLVFSRLDEDGRLRPRPQAGETGQG